jgi:hypothetical protein
MRPAGIRLRVRPLVSVWIVIELTLPPSSTAITACPHSCTHVVNSVNG